MKKKISGGFSLGVLLIILCLVLVACGGGSSSGDGTVASSVAIVDCSTVTSAATVTATAANTFNPPNVTISANSVVRWISDSNVNHTVTSGIVTGGTVTTATPDGKFDQPLNPKGSNGSSVCLKFTEAGTYNYYCTHHYTQGMKGVVTVQ